MTEKVCKLYEEEQIGKTKEGRKAVPTNKMPDLGWDIAETQLPHENQENNDPHKTPSLQTLFTVIIMLITILEYMTTYAKEIVKKTVQAVKSTITEVSCNELLQNIKDYYQTATLVVAIATNTMDRTNLTNEPTHQMEICRNIQACENLMTSTTDCTSRTHPGPTVTAATSMTSCSTVSVYFTQRPNTEMETPEHKTLNNALVPKNKVLSTTWKLSVSHAPSHT